MWQPDVPDFIAPNWGKFQGQQIRPPRVKRPIVQYYAGRIEDFLPEKDVPEKHWWMLRNREIITDYQPGHIHLAMAQEAIRLYGEAVVKNGRMLIPHLTIDIPLAHVSKKYVRIMARKGIRVLRPDGRAERWCLVAVSGSGQRQASLSFWPKEWADRSLTLMTGEYRDLWLQTQLAPSKVINYVAIGFSSLSFILDGDRALSPETHFIYSDGMEITHEGVPMLANGYRHTLGTIDQDKTDGIIAVSRDIMDRYAQQMGHLPGSLSLFQVRGPLGSGIKGVVMAYPDLPPNTVIGFASACKLINGLKDMSYEEKVKLLERMMRGVLGVCRVNRMTPSQQSGVTSTSAQLWSLIPKDLIDGEALIQALVDEAKTAITDPVYLRYALGVKDELKDSDVLDAANDQSWQKAYANANFELAIKDPEVRRFTQGAVVSNARKTSAHGRLPVAGLDLIQVPEPAVIQAIYIAHMKDGSRGLKGSLDEIRPLLEQAAEVCGYKLLEADEVMTGAIPESQDGREVVLNRYPLQHPDQLAVVRARYCSPEKYGFGCVFLCAVGVLQAQQGGSDFDGDEIKMYFWVHLVAVVKMIQTGRIIENPPTVKVKAAEFKTDTEYRKILAPTLLKALLGAAWIGTLSNMSAGASALMSMKSMHRDKCKEMGVPEGTSLREVVMGIFVREVMRAVDYVKTSDKPVIEKSLAEAGVDLEETPFVAGDNGLSFRLIDDEDKSSSFRPVYQGVPPQYRVQIEAADNTVMGVLRSKLEATVKEVRESTSEHSEEEVQSQFLQLTTDLKVDEAMCVDVMHCLVNIYPKEVEAKRRELGAIRKGIHEAMSGGKKLLKKELEKLKSDLNRQINLKIQGPTVHALGLLSELTHDEQLRTTALLYTKAPSKARLFCRSQLLDLYLLALEKPAVKVPQIAKAGILPVGESVHYGHRSVAHAARILEAAKRLVVRKELDERIGGQVHKIYALAEDREVCVGRLIGKRLKGENQSWYHEYADTLLNIELSVESIRISGDDARSFFIAVQPPSLPFRPDIWIQQTSEMLHQAEDLAELRSIGRQMKRFLASVSVPEELLQASRVIYQECEATLKAHPPEMTGNDESDIPEPPNGLDVDALLESDEANYGWSDNDQMPEFGEVDDTSFTDHDE